MEGRLSGSSRCSLLDDLIRPQQHRLGDREAEGLRGLQVHDQLELGGLLDGQVAGLCTLEDLIHVGSGTPIQIGKVRSIGHKAPGIDKLPPWVHCRQPVLCRQVHEASSLTEEHGAYQHSQSTRARPGHVREGPVEVLRPSRLNELKPHPQRPRRDVGFLQYVLIRAFALATWLPEGSDPTDPGTACVSCSRPLPTSSGPRPVNPVTLPPGRARLVTSPLVTGSPAAAKTMGTVLVACLAARAWGVPPATMTSTLSATSSAARAGSRSNFPSASRYSITTLPLST